MSKVVIVQLEWKYSPENYLEEQISVPFEGVSLEVGSGRALAAIDPVAFQNNETMRNDLHRLIESRLHAVQIMTHTDFELSKPLRIDIGEGGKKNYFLEVDSIVKTVSMGSVDFIVKDKDGNIVSDSKKERLEKQKWFACTVDKYRSKDNTLDQMLKSYQMSVKDSDNELVHLYEIRDALSKKFRSKENAIKHLAITSNKWDEIGELANNRPLKQGRHRGKSAGFLRDAELSELEQGRKLAANLIERYLEYLTHNA